MRGALANNAPSARGPKRAPRNAGPGPELVLGTAQLGMPYGVANRSGCPDENEAFEIVKQAWAGGVRIFDTAQHYGRSEKVLGGALAAAGIADQAKVVTKLAPALDLNDERALTSALAESGKILGQGQVWGCLLHNTTWLDKWRQGPGPVLRGALESGAIRHLGVSVYEKHEARKALGIPGIKLVQAPLNAWSMDTEWEEILAEVRERGCKVFLRSIYLQGLLLMTPSECFERLPQAAAALKRWRGLARELGCTPQELAMRFVAGLGFPVVVGLETRKQLLENLLLAREVPLEAEERQEVMSQMKPLLSGQLIDPRQWPAK